MAWIPTPESSNLTGFGYDEGRSVLTVQFNSGGRYEYYDVPSQVFDQMCAAPSKGSFLASNVKSVYRYARV